MDRRGVTPRGLWLLFAQAVTLMLAVLFVASLLRPGLLFEDDAGLFGHRVDEITFSRSLSRVLPSVVSVRAAVGDGVLDGAVFADYDIGSGVVVSEEGHVITNHHVIDGGGEIQVITGAGERLDAELLGSDPGTDIAVLKVRPEAPLPAVAFKDSRTPVRAGDLVMSVGSPYGLQNTASLGIVSAIGRNDLGLSRYEHFIQTDAAINHGSSGGALLNTRGELVGISTALFSKRVDGVKSQGIGFAIPVELAEAAYEQIVRHGEFRRGWIGLELGNIDPLDEESAGMDAWVVRKVEPGSPSERAGVEVGDLLVGINDREPSKISFLEEATGELMTPGEVMEMSLVRDGEGYKAYIEVLEK